MLFVHECEASAAFGTISECSHAASLDQLSHGDGTLHQQLLAAVRVLKRSVTDAIVVNLGVV